MLTLKILFISQELIGSGLCQRLVREGHQVKLYIFDPARKNCMTGLVEKTLDWRSELNWVGHEGVIIFDDVGHGALQDELRSKGYVVFGGNVAGDLLELDRSHAQKVLADCGLSILPHHEFPNVASAVEFVRYSRELWVAKQTTHMSVLNHVGQSPGGEDVVEALKTWEGHGIQKVHLQKKVSGVEVATARFFNGTDWVGPIEVSHEHKRLLNGDHGPLTAEMGTVMWFSDDEDLPLFAATLKKLAPFLREINYRGDIDINCIVTKDDAWPLELTPRLGTPAIQVQSEMITSSLADFIFDTASGKSTGFSWRPGYGIVASIALPPFPYPPEAESDSIRAFRPSIQISPKLSTRDLQSIHLEEVSVRQGPDGRDELFWSGEFGYAAYVTGSGLTIPEAQSEVLRRLRSVSVPDMIYRTDIGDRVHNHDFPLLREWGWI